MVLTAHSAHTSRRGHRELIRPSHRRLVKIRSRSAFEKRIAYCNRCPSSHVPSVSAALFHRPGRSTLMNYTDHRVENDVAYCQTIAPQKHLPVRTALSLSVQGPQCNPRHNFTDHALHPGLGQIGPSSPLKFRAAGPQLLQRSGISSHGWPALVGKAQPQSVNDRTSFFLWQKKCDASAWI
jgi:hypothetical protein